MNNLERVLGGLHVDIDNVLNKGYPITTILTTLILKHWPNAEYLTEITGEWTEEMLWRELDSRIATSRWSVRILREEFRKDEARAKLKEEEE